MKTYVRLIVEAARGISEAESEGYALFATDWNSGQLAMLYDPEYVTRALVGGKLPTQSAGPVVAYITTKRRSNMKGHMYGARSIASAAARKGWGPMLYDFIISSSKVAPDRLSVSDQAASVWSYYKNKRPDVTKQKIDNVRAPVTPTPEDDGEVYTDGGPENPLNYVYSANHDMTSEYSRLATNHSEFCDKLESKRGIKRSEFEDYIRKCGSIFFFKKYEG